LIEFISAGFPDAIGRDRPCFLLNCLPVSGGQSLGRRAAGRLLIAFINRNEREGAQRGVEKKLQASGFKLQACSSPKIND
jgi:hypothetical protein